MSMKRDALMVSAGILTVALALGACSPSATVAVGQPTWLTEIDALRPSTLAEGARLQVVATTSLVADLLGNVGADGIEMTALLPLGIDPHTYEPSPQDMRAIAEADVVFLNGLGLEETLSETVRNAGGGAPIVSLSEGIVPLRLEGEAGGPDPHVWLDPNNLVVWAENAAAALAALDPARADYYRSNAEAYAAALRDLDARIRDRVAQIPEADRKLITDHDELGYFAVRYGFEIVGALIPAYSSAAEPSAQELSQLETTIRELGTRAVFVGTGVNQELAARVAEDTGVRLVPLYTHSLSGPDGPATSYRTLMEYNVNAIVEALR